MSIWNTLFSWFNSSPTSETSISEIGMVAFDDHHCDINPANGLPMVGGCGGIDIQGNAYGTDWSHDDSWSSSHIGDDSFSSPTSWDNDIGNSWDT